MALLNIALQEGFIDDDVVITVNDKEIFRKSGVKTRFQIGLADTVEYEALEDSLDITVTIPSKRLKNSISVNLLFPLYLGVSITMDEQIRFIVSSTPFGYV